MLKSRRKKKKFNPSVIDTLTFLKKIREAEYERVSRDLKKIQAIKTGEAVKDSGKTKKSSLGTSGG